MENKLTKNSYSLSNNSYLIYLFLLFIPHFLFFGIMANLENVLVPFLMLMGYDFIMSYAFLYKFNTPVNLLVHLIALIVLQNVSAGIGMSIFGNQTNGENIKLLMVFKEAYAIILALLLYAKEKRNIRLLKFENVIPITAILLVISYSISPGSGEAKVYYLRGFAILFVPYVIGRLFYYAIGKSQYKINRVANHVVSMGVLSACVGFLFLIIDRHSSIWKNFFNLGYLMQAKGSEYTDFPDWFTPIGSLVLPRMFSFFFDAINLSYFLATAIIFTYFLNKKGLMFVRLFLFISLLFTFGKGAIGIVLLTAAWYYLIYKIRLNQKFIRKLFIVGIIAGLFIISNINLYSSISVHFEGFLNPLINSVSKPFGHGLGTGGIYVAMLQKITAYQMLHTGAESFFGTLIYQLGYPGLILYTIFFNGSIKYLLAYSKINVNDRRICLLLTGVMFALFAVSLMQEATFGLNYTGILTLFVGIYVSKAQNEMNTIEKRAN